MWKVAIVWTDPFCWQYVLVSTFQNLSIVLGSPQGCSGPGSPTCASEKSWPLPSAGPAHLCPVPMPSLLAIWRGGTVAITLKVGKTETALKGIDIWKKWGGAERWISYGTVWWLGTERCQHRGRNRVSMWAWEWLSIWKMGKGCKLTSITPKEHRHFHSTVRWVNKTISNLIVSSFTPLTVCHGDMPVRSSNSALIVKHMKLSRA